MVAVISRNILRYLIISFLMVLSAVSSAFAQRWSFAAFSDNRNFEIAYRNVLDSMKSGGPADPRFPKPDFVVAVGDIDPVKRTLDIFRSIMGPNVPFIPVRGNHESSGDVTLITKEILPSEYPPVTVYNRESATFYYDWKNVRIIVIDQYAAGSKNFGDPNLLHWIEKAIVSAKAADHVFVAFHEPRFAFYGKLDPFWGLLLKHDEKVRAVLWGHIHSYSRTNLHGSHGGIELINAGAAGNTGHSDGMNTFLQISIDGNRVALRAVQAPDKTRNFKVTDRWETQSSQN